MLGIVLLQFLCERTANRSLPPLLNHPEAAVLALVYQGRLSASTSAAWPVTARLPSPRQGFRERRRGAKITWTHGSFRAKDFALACFGDGPGHRVPGALH